MNSWLCFSLIVAVFTVGIISPTIPTAHAQESISVNSTTPCFLNYTAGSQMIDNCGFDEDYLAASLLPWEWITGGNFSMVLAGIFIMFTYIKYHKAVYPIMIGVIMLPLSFFVFPDAFLSWAILMAFVTLGILIWFVYIKQTKEYN